MTPLAKALEMPATAQRMPATKEQRLPTPRRVGTLPEGLLTSGGWLSALASEQIHALGTHVLARHSEQGLRTLAVTSALAGEGKTTVSLALAQKIASADKRVLVIDLDTHRGTLSETAQLGDVPGAMDTSNPGAQGRSPLHCYATDCPGVFVMPTGKIEDDIPLLSPERVLKLAKRGLEEFDLIIFDCPPLLPVADTHVIGEVADSAILVVRAGRTPKEMLDQALMEFGREKFFAAVLNRARPYNIPYFREVYGYYQRPRKSD